MKASDLYRLMENPSLLTGDTLSELKQMVDEVPYFHTARMLYLKNLAVLNDARFSAELKKMVVYIPDRRKLFLLIEGDKYGLHQTTESSVADANDTFALIDAFLSSGADEHERTAETSLLFQPSVSSDYIYWSLTKEEPSVEEDNTAKLQHHDLIDSFIKNDEQRAPGSGMALPMNIDSSNNPLPKPIANPGDEYAKSLDDSYFTETLARIYVKQKRYEKALQIIKNLSLKYPEKNVYFADQIRFLEKLIINTKK